MTFGLETSASIHKLTRLKVEYIIGKMNSYCDHIIILLGQANLSLTEKIWKVQNVVCVSFPVENAKISVCLVTTAVALHFLSFFLTCTLQNPAWPVGKCCVGESKFSLQIAVSCLLYQNLSPIITIGCTPPVHKLNFITLLKKAPTRRSLCTNCVWNFITAKRHI